MNLSTNFRNSFEFINKFILIHFKLSTNLSRNSFEFINKFIWNHWIESNYLLWLTYPWTDRYCGFLSLSILSIARLKILLIQKVKSVCLTTPMAFIIHVLAVFSNILRTTLFIVICDALWLRLKKEYFTVWSIYSSGYSDSQPKKTMPGKWQLFSMKPIKQK